MPRGSAAGERPARDSIESVLNEHREQVWELVTVLALSADGQITFTGVIKRELPGGLPFRRREETREQPYGRRRPLQRI